MTSTSTWYPPSLGTGGFLIDPTNPPFTMNEPTTQAPALSPDLFADLLEQATRAQNPKGLLAELARLAYTAGADAELEECRSWLKTFCEGEYVANCLRAARRPKPPSLKEQALQVLGRMHETCLTAPATDTIRRALELIPDA